MNVFTLLSRKAPNRIFLSIFFGALSGVAYSLMIPLIATALKEPDARFPTQPAVSTTLWLLKVTDAPIALLFASSCAFILVCKTLSQIALAGTAVDMASELRVELYRKIMDAPLSALERVGIPKLISALTQDIPAFISGAQLLPDLLVHVVTVVGMLGFLFWLNSGMFWFVLGAILFGVLTYQAPMLLGSRHFLRSRVIGDLLDTAIHSLVRGMKELKLNGDKRQEFFDTLLLNYESQLLKSAKTGNNIVRTASNYGEMICFFIMGALAFVFQNYRSVSNAELLTGIMVLLYITGPIAAILHVVPTTLNARIAIGRFSELATSLSSENVEHHAVPVEPWDAVRFEGVRFEHVQPGDKGFAVGPIDLEFRRGQITFVVGGNGSGKSTLCKLLTLHYAPTGGQIFFGNTLVSGASVSACRDEIAAIYSDYHLFDRLLGIRAAPGEIDDYLRLLKLENKVRYEDGRFSTLSLSDGQRRRLALLVAFIEDKALYLFDEWAADQDPLFKKIFYHEILPSLKAKGKAVVAITHDDRYFHLADKIVTMENGVVADVAVHRQPPADAAVAESAVQTA